MIEMVLILMQVLISSVNLERYKLERYISIWLHREHVCPKFKKTLTFRESLQKQMLIKFYAVLKQNHHLKINLSFTMFGQEWWSSVFFFKVPCTCFRLMLI